MRPLILLVLAGALASAASCSDAAAPGPPGQATSPTAPRPTDPTGPLPTAIAPAGPKAREIPVNAHLLFQGPIGYGGAPIPAGIQTNWRSRDPSIATVGPFGNQQPMGYVVGVRPGTTIIEGTLLGVTAALSVTVLAPAPAATVPPVVVDFQMLEVPAGGSGYVPQLVLRDTTGRGGSAIIGAKFDIPGVGESSGCAMLRPIGSTPLTVFHEMYGDFEFSIGSNTRATGSEAVAHVILRVPGPAAMTVDVRGPIVPGAFPTTYTPDPNLDALSCG